MSPARHQVNGKIGLRFTKGGFGTPFFGDDRQLRVESGKLTIQQADQAEALRITTIGAACEAAEIGYEPDWFAGFRDPLTPDDPEADLAIEENAVSALGSLYGFAHSVLEELRATSQDGDQPSLVQLWPEHFDVGLDLGEATKSGRATFGLSPGDQDHPEPYLYVSAWTAVDRSEPFWNDHFFNGASLAYQQLLDAVDQRALALEFFQRARALLARISGL
jgi:hypothetical protein